MAIIDFLIDKLFWAFVGAAGTVLWFKATHSCVDTIIGMSCLDHPFDLQKAFGI